MDKDKIYFSIQAGGSLSSWIADFEVPKGTKVKEICDLLEIDKLNEVHWMGHGIGNPINLEEEITSGQYYWVDYETHKKFDRIYQRFKESENVECYPTKN